MGGFHLFSDMSFHDLWAHQNAELTRVIDGMSDSYLVDVDLEDLVESLSLRFHLDVPALGEPYAKNNRVKIRVDRDFGGPARPDRPSVEVDGYDYILQVPFSGDQIVFTIRPSSFLSPPFGAIWDGKTLEKSVSVREPDVHYINSEFEAFLRSVKQHLSWLDADFANFNNSLRTNIEAAVRQRRDRAAKAAQVATQLIVPIRERSSGDTFTTPVKRKQIIPQLPRVKPGAPPEPILSEEIYGAILDTMSRMAVTMEKSPQAYSTLDEEALRFQFLVPLNAHFELEAHGEAFNYRGKTDILISRDGRSVFIAECKIWKGREALSEAIDQLLGYLAWRDTKCALLIFSRNKNFTQVLDQIRPTIEAHVQFVRFDRADDQTRLRFTFRRQDDPGRLLALTVLAFQVPIAP